MCERANIDVNGFCFICFYEGGPYAAFGGRDASRGLATFKVTSSDTEEYDDLSDLDTMEMDSVREWEAQFKGNSTRSHLKEINQVHMILI